MRIFKRKIYDKMLQWKKERDGKTALLIKGARRVGKSTIAKEFAQKEYDSYIVVDFADAPTAVWEAVKNIADRNNFFLQLQFIYGVTLYERRSVIIFDEIQKCPEARQAIKYLVQDHRYDYIETGSLLSIKKNTENIVIPSEETRLTLYPLDYEEFRWALGDDSTIPLLQQAFQSKKALGDGVCRKLLRDFRLYMLVGGMPQAIDTYLETNNLSSVDEKKREIIELYNDDFFKIDPSGKAAKLFSAIPSQLSKNASRYQETSVLGRTEDKEKMEELLRNLEDSLTVNFAHHANDPNVGMPLHADYSQYKMYMGDTGLFVTLAFWDKEVTDNVIYQKLLSDKLSTDMGYVYENVVAQMLTSAGNRLFYHTWPTESGKHNYEIDFILSRGSKIDPIEVKSSSYKTHASLDAFKRKFSDRIGHSYLVYAKDLQKDQDTLLVPTFMTMFL
ncbi:MAG: ATP-binding protein [Bacteroidales bacterium]|nr:ATP-binding protein [Bacteroidales bacterium]MBP5679441.1 ATP-binding protein [Bacteroidales bacterium]MBQ7238932.1 ATP-binding protein [Bacteroidales bacterium]